VNRSHAAARHALPTQRQLAGVILILRFSLQALDNASSRMVVWRQMAQAGIADTVTQLNYDE
jgi:hypothetical protein